MRFRLHAPRFLFFSGLLLSLGNSVGTAQSPDEADPTLTSVAELRALTPDEADRQLPVRLTGVVTYVEDRFNMLYLQDATGGTFVGGERNIIAPDRFNRSLRAGDRIEVSGVTHRGKFIPHLDGGQGSLQIRILGEAPLPSPRRPPRGRFFHPHFHNQWVEVQGYVIGQQANGRWLSLNLLADGQRLNALVLGPWREQKPPDFTNSDLRVQGVYGAEFNEAREMEGANVLVPATAQLEIIDPGLKRAFSQKAVPIREVRQFRPAPTERLRVKGVVTWREDGRGFYLGDGDAAAWVRLASGNLPEIGQGVQVVGFPVIENTSLSFQDSVARPLEDPSEVAAMRPSVLPLDAKALTSGQSDRSQLTGRVVRLEGNIVDRLKLPDTWMLALRNTRLAFQARYARADPRPWAPPNHSQVVLTGIFEPLQAGDRDPSASFQILMRDRDDIAVLQKPPYWTVRRVTWLASVLGIIVVVAGAWAVTLRRRVTAQTGIIAEQIESQRLAEERSRIGRDLHDTLEQHLTGVALQIDAAGARLPDSHPARNSLDTASAMLAHSRQEARRSVWDLKASSLEQDGLPGALRDLADSRTTDGTEITLDLPDTWSRLDGKTELHLLRISQEAVTNALKHAGASRIALRLWQDAPSSGADTAATLHLSIHDNGCGFDPDRKPVDGRLHFGLAGMKERAGKLKGRMEIQSSPDEGTEIHLTLPLPPQAAPVAERRDP